MLKRALLVVMLCSATPVLRATVIVPADFREIVNGSDIICYGRVIETTVRMADDRKRVDTLVTMQVGTYLKGGPGETIVFTVAGGQVGRFRNITVGAPHFAVGEEAIVFLNTRDGDRPFVYGFNQGVFRVRLDDRTSRRVVTPPALMLRGAAPEVLVRGSAERRPLPIETFGARVQAVLADAASARSAR